MRFRRRRYAARRIRRRRYKRRSFKRRGRGRRSWGSKVYSYRRTYISPFTYANGVGYAETFQLSSVPNYSELVALYDQYMITKVVVKVRPPGNVVELNAKSATFHSAIDYTDVGPVTSVNQLLEYATRKSTPANRVHTRVLRPAFQRRSYETTLSDGYSAGRGWLNTADESVPHYGLKWWLYSTFGEVAYNCQLEYTYYLKFRNQK